MSTGQAWWAHKNETYLELCEEFGEAPEYSEGARGLMFLDSIGAHAENLMERYKRDKDETV